MRLARSIVRGLSALALALAVFSSASAQQAPRAVMDGWEPRAFRVVCPATTLIGEYLRSAQEALGLDQACMEAAPRRKLEQSAEMFVAHYEREGLAAPFRFGPVVTLDEPPDSAVGMLAKKASGYASVGPRSGTCAPEDEREMHVNPKSLAALPDHVLAHVAGHELLHAVQGNYPAFMKPGRDGPHDCFPPHWVIEGIADAVAIGQARKMYGWFWPPHPGQKAGWSWAGLRPYDKPLFDAGLDAKQQYRTSSLWRFLIDRFHGGRVKFLEDYLLVSPPEYAANSEDWVGWLNGNLRSDPRIDTPLYLVYPGFLTDLAGQWARGGYGERFGRDKWLNGAFGGCARITLSPQEPYVEQDLSLAALSGRCISVRVQGLAPGERATVKLGAFGADLAEVDSLHLGFAFTNGDPGFNCAALTRYGGLPHGVAGCILEPVTGTIGGVKALRMWHGTPLGLAGQSAAGVLENVYVLAHTPPRARLEELEHKTPLKLSIAAGLDLAKLAGAPAVPGRGGSGGRSSKSGESRTGAAGAMGIHPLEGDQTLPASAGFVDAGPVQDMFSPEMTALLGGATEMMRGVGGSLWGGLGSGFGAGFFRVGQVEATPAGIGGETVKVLTEINILAEEQFPEGTTGTFEVSLFGRDKRSSDIIFVTPGPSARATLSIRENSYGAFRASFQGPVCRLPQSQMPVAAERAERRGTLCTDPVPVSGEIVKPFAFTYRTTTPFHSFQTEGERLYNRYHIGARPMRSGPTAHDGDGGGNGGGSGGGAGSGGGGAVPIPPGCDCSCEARASQASRCEAPCAHQQQSCAPGIAAGAREAAPSADDLQARKAKRAKAVAEGQLRRFSRLLDERDLSPEARQMLIEDFKRQSEGTRNAIIHRFFRDGSD